MTPKLQRNGIFLLPILLCLVRSRSGSGWSVFGPLVPLAVIKTPLIRSLTLVIIILFIIITTMLLRLRSIVVVILIVDVIVVVTSIRSRRSVGRGSCLKII